MKEHEEAELKVSYTGFTRSNAFQAKLSLFLQMIKRTQAVWSNLGKEKNLEVFDLNEE